MRIKCLAQGHTTENSSEARLEPPTNLLIVIREAYPLDHWVLTQPRYANNYSEPYVADKRDRTVTLELSMTTPSEIPLHQGFPLQSRDLHKSVFFFF